MNHDGFQGTFHLKRAVYKKGFYIAICFGLHAVWTVSMPRGETLLSSYFIVLQYLWRWHFM